MPHLGLIVLDEEHERSFKQEQRPRYHARDVALRARATEKVPLVLGSATPSLESWHRAQAGASIGWSRCRGACSIGRMPAVGTIDLRNEVRSRQSPRRDQPAAALGPSTRRSTTAAR